MSARAADISSCGTYRYTLSRWLDFKDGQRYDAPYVAWIMLNPSKADAAIDDPTIRRCMGFTYAWGYCKLVVVNLFAFRATDPRELQRRAMVGDNIIGPHNEMYVRDVIADLSCERIVCAWGQPKYTKKAGEWALNIIASCGQMPRALRLSKDGTPRHPLYLPGDLLPEEWDHKRGVLL